jgi:hypothetical protein
MSDCRFNSWPEIEEQLERIVRDAAGAFDQDTVVNGRELVRLPQRGHARHRLLRKGLLAHVFADVVAINFVRKTEPTGSERSSRSQSARRTRSPGPNSVCDNANAI